jgi:hypothetical protein
MGEKLHLDPARCRQLSLNLSPLRFGQLTDRSQLAAVSS